MRARPATVVALAQAAALLPLAALLGTWTDEEYTLASTAHGLSFALARALGFEQQAPLYFVVLAAWRALDASPFFARLFSVLCVLATTFLVAALARRLVPSLSPLAFGAAFALNPFVFFCALEIRLYALALLLSAALMLAFYEGFVKERRPMQVAFVVLGLCAVYTQYFLAFLFAGFALYLWIVRGPRALIAFGAALAAIVAGALPLVAALAAQVGSVERVSDPWNVIAWRCLKPLVEFPLPGYWDRGRRLHAAFVAVSVAAIALIIAGKPRFDRERWGLVAIPAAFVALFVASMVATRTLAYIPRYEVGLFVPLALAVFGLLAGFRRVPSVARGVLLTMYLASSLVSLFLAYHTLAKNGDWIRVGAYLRANARPGDTIAVVPADATLGLERYYQGPARVVAIPHAASLERYDFDRFVFHSDDEARIALDRLRTGRGRLWLVTEQACLDGSLPLGCAHLWVAVARSFAVEQTATFDGTTLERLLRR